MLFKSKISKRQINIENRDDYEYILNWVKRSHIKNLKSFFEFAFREHSEEELKRFGQEPLKSSWGKLTNEEQVHLTYILSELFLERLNDDILS